MTKQVDFSKYAIFVDGVTSDPSKDYQSFIESLSALNTKGANIERLTTAAVGISAEGGEFMEIVKKMVFQGKPYNCILYTSPSPRDFAISRMPSAA